MDNKIAIDFGTSRTKVAYYNPATQRPALVRLGSRAEAIPSLFHYDKNGKIHIGENAQEMLKDDPGGSIAGLKSKLRSMLYVNYAAQKVGSIAGLKSKLRSMLYVNYEQKVAPEALLVRLFTEIRTYVESDRSIVSQEQGPPLSVVLTTPGFYRLPERKGLKSAAEAAGFKPPVELLPEPEAAARAWLALGAPENANEYNDVIVLDCGGGTLDWAYLHKGKDGKFHENLHLPPDAVDKIGGEDVDKALLTKLLKGRECENVPMLLKDVRDRKEAYCSDRPVRPVRVGPDQFVTLEARDIQAVIDEAFITPACDLIMPYLKEVERVTGREIPPILLVGGSSKLKGLKEGLEKRCGCKVFKWHQAEFATVLGAAVPLPREQERDATYARCCVHEH